MKSNRLRKLLCVIVVFFISAQSLLFAANSHNAYFDQALSVSDHCKANTNSPVNNEPECCDKIAMDYAHCNNCYGFTMALLPLTETLPAFNHSEHRFAILSTLLYPEPVLEHFKPPI